MKFVSTHQPTRYHRHTSDAHCLETQQAFRHNLASELQSQIVQALTTLKLNLATIQEAPPDSPPLAGSLTKSISLVERTMARVQTLVSDLRATHPAVPVPFRATLPAAAPSTSPEAASLSALTPREQEVLAHLSKGCLDKEIAHALGISTWTVHAHVKNIFGRLGVRTRTEAVIRYLQK